MSALFCLYGESIMHFDEKYFEGEERNGFYIKPMMKRAWAAQLEILQQIDQICQRNNIEYFVSSGTLLGAIRHGGFIPWDDDLDIEMKRLDYERFLKIAAKELPEGYRVSGPAIDSSWRIPFSRVLNSKEIPLKRERLQQFHGFPWQAGVDIFPIDCLPDDESEEDIMLGMYRAAYMLAIEWEKCEMSEEERMENLRELEMYCNVCFTQDESYSFQLWTLIDRIAAMYWDKENEAKKVSMIYMLAKQPDLKFSSSWYKDKKWVPFENITVPVPGGYEQILTVLYGKDYMTPKQYEVHEYPFYKKQQKIVWEFYKKRGLEIPKELLE